MKKKNKKIKDIKKINTTKESIKFDNNFGEMYESLMLQEKIKEENLNKIFKEKGITWTIKPHNDELLEILEKMKIKKIDSFIGADFIEVVEYILENPLNDKIFKF